MKKRVFLTVLDSVGIGALPDAASFGDEGANTLKSCFETGLLNIPNLIKMGLSRIDGCEYLGSEPSPLSSFGRCRERSAGKDTTTGHWEIAGLVSKQSFPTYPDGYPEEILSQFRKKTGRGVLCNKPYSGTEVLKDYGKEHLETGDLIVYTSADSVFQIAAHEDIVVPETLYEYCKIAREILTGEHGVGRVIARPFVGEVGNFVRTKNRRDFSVKPTGKTLLDILKDAGKDVISVGKINDIFAGAGVTMDTDSHGNDECMAKTLEMLKIDFDGLCFINLVDFDSSFGHRNDAVGYARELNRYDSHLGVILEELREDDLFIITADHGCDPSDVSTDHTREYTPLLVYGKNLPSVKLFTRDGFCDIAATVAEYLGVEYDLCGNSFLGDITCAERLKNAAITAMNMAYAPYSGFKVGAALLSSDGEIFTGCNIENSAFSPTICAERVAFSKAVSEGKRAFCAIAVCGAKDGILTDDECFPCGVCRQVMREFCDDGFVVYTVTKNGANTYKFSEILPHSFSL